MNAKRRERLSTARNYLSRACDIIDSVNNEESNCLYNFPENLQGSERYEQIESAVYDLEEAAANVGEALSILGHYE